MLGEMFLEGIRHITDFEGYDHMLFLVVLCAPYHWRDWRPVAILATAFTVGHSLSLLAATLGLVWISGNVVEVLIPVTILITAALNVFVRQRSTRWPAYALALVFGLIHGLGFSGYFRMLYFQDTALFHRLIMFNLGVEVGQLLIIMGYFLLAVIILQIPGLKIRKLNIIMSSIAAVLAVFMLISRLSF